MRTTITLSDDLHELLLSIARIRRLTLSATIEEIITRSLRDETPAREDRLSRSRKTGLPVVRLGLSGGARVGRPVTVDDVRALDDE